MTDDWREELIERIAKAAWESDGTRDWKRVNEPLRKFCLRNIRAALAVAEPAIREQCAAEADHRAKTVGNGEDEYSLACRHIAAAIREGEMIGDRFTIQQFKELVADGFFTDYDGEGRGIDSDGHVRDDVIIKPSRANEIPDDIVAVLWANR